MVDRRTRPFSIISKKYTFILLALLSGIISAIWVAIDIYTGEAIIIDSEGETNEYAFAIHSMLIGFVVSILFVFILWIPISKKPFIKLLTKIKKTDEKPNTEIKNLGNKVAPKEKPKRSYSYLGQLMDPQFQGIRIPSKKMFLWLALSGLVMGGNNIIYFYLLKNTPISIFLPISQFVIIYLLLGDLIIDRVLPCSIEIQSIVMIAIGVILAAIEFELGSFTGLNIFLILVVLNGTSAAYVIFQKKAVMVKYKNERTLDSTNIRIWTLLFMTIFTVLFALPFMDAAGWYVYKSTFLMAIFPCALSMLLVFISRILYVRALSMGKMSIVNSLSSISVIVGIPINIIGYYIWPQYFSIPLGDYAWILWLLRAFGAILVFAGIVGLSSSEVKMIVFAKIKSGVKWNLNSIKSIPGVEKASIITGKYDLMIVIHSRTIGRGYQSTIEKLEQISYIKSFTTSTVLKEWTP